MQRLAKYLRPSATARAIQDQVWDAMLDRIAQEIARTDAADEPWRRHPGLFAIDPKLSLADLRIGKRIESARGTAEAPVPFAGPVALPAP